MRRYPLIAEALAARLRQLRADARLSQHQMAARLGASQPAVSNYEEGTREPPLWILIGYARVFALSLDGLVPPAAIEADGGEDAA